MPTPFLVVPFTKQHNKQFPLTFIQFFQRLWFEDVILFINISFAFDARIILNTSMYIVSEHSHHVLAKYKIGFPIDLKESGIWLANLEKFHETRCKNTAVLYRKTVAWDFKKSLSTRFSFVTRWN